MEHEERKKGGRPKQPHPRNILIKCLLNAKEHARFLGRVQRSGHTKSEYVRTLLFGQKNSIIQQKINPVEYQKFMTSLTRIGVSLNQVARVLNVDQAPTPEQLSRLAGIEKELLPVLYDIKKKVYS